MAKVGINKRPMNRLISLILLFTFFCSCSRFGKHCSECSIQNSNAQKLYFFPTEPEMNWIDSSILKISTDYLKSVKESSLFCFQPISESFRFVYIRSFHNPLMIKITADSIIIKKDFDGMEVDTVLNIPKLPPEEAEILRTWVRYQGNWNKTTKELFYKKYLRVFDTNYINYLTKKALDISYKYHKLHVSRIPNCKIDFENLKEHLRKSGFWDTRLKINMMSPCLDGAIWFLEAQSKDCYHFYYIHCPDDGPFKELCLDFIRYANLQDNEIY